MALGAECGVGEFVAEKQTGDQPDVPCTRPGKLPLRMSNPPNRNNIRVAGDVAVAAEQATGALVEIGNDNDVGLVIARAGFQPRFPFTHVVGRSHVCVSVSATDLQATEFVDQEEVDHTSHRIGSVHSRGAVLQDIDVIDHGEGNQLDVVAAEQCSLRDAFAIDQDQSLFWQQTRAGSSCTVPSPPLAMFWLTVPPASCGIKVVRSRGVADTQLLDVLRPVGVHRVRAGLFRRGNVRTGHDHALDLSRRRWRAGLAGTAGAGN